MNTKLEINNLIVKRLQGILKDKQIKTIYRLSKITGIHKSTLGYIFSNKFDIKTKTLAKICLGLNISIAEFFNHELFY